MSKFFYFGYGSNLLARRIHMNSPSAVRKGYGYIKDFRLDFMTFSKRWKGASATIVPTPGKKVWGAIWELNIKDRDNLDFQEGVHDKIYFPFDVDVHKPDGSVVKCRVYQQTSTPELLKEGEIIPVERRPSEIYKEYIVRGAVETELPESYIEELKKVPSVPVEGEVDLSLRLTEV